MAMSSLRSVDVLVQRVITDGKLASDLRDEPIATLLKLAEEAKRDTPAAEDTPWLYVTIVMIIGLTAVIAVGGAVWITLAGWEVPDLLTALGSGAIGALAGYLTPQYRR